MIKLLIKLIQPSLIGRDKQTAKAPFVFDFLTQAGPLAASTKSRVPSFAGVFSVRPARTRVMGITPAAGASTGTDLFHAWVCLAFQRTCTRGSKHRLADLSHGRYVIALTLPRDANSPACSAAGSLLPATNLRVRRCPSHGHSLVVKYFDSQNR